MRQVLKQIIVMDNITATTSTPVKVLPLDALKQITCEPIH